MFSHYATEKHPILLNDQAAARDAQHAARAKGSGQCHACAGDSLNIAVTDGEHVVAIRYRSCATEDPPSLYFALGDRWDASGMANPQHLPMNTTEHHGSTALLVASEPLTASNSTPWRLMAKDQMLSYEVASGALELHCLTKACKEDVRHRCGAAGEASCPAHLWDDRGDEQHTFAHDVLEGIRHEEL